MGLNMIKKRLVGSVIVKNGIAVQSFGFSKYLPLGSDEAMVENLNRWGVDEIMISVIDRSKKKLGPDYELLKRLSKINVSTPIVYAGGITSHYDAAKVIENGAERVAVDNMIFKNFNELINLSNIVGSQALIISLPVTFKQNLLYHYNYLRKKSQEFSLYLRELIENKLISELLIIDWKNEGGIKKFNEKIIEKFPFKNVPLILFGGIYRVKQINRLISNNNVNAILIGNYLSYKEMSVQNIKNAVNSGFMRPASFEKQL